MPVSAGIYGYHITKPIEFPSRGLRLEPRTTEFIKARDWADDRRAFQLTAVLHGPWIDDAWLFDLAAVLSFVEQHDVLVTSPRQFLEADPLKAFDVTLPLAPTQGFGLIINYDSFAPSSRASFIALALDRLADTDFCEKTKFRQFFFKCVEAVRQRHSFVEVQYFLLFSGLEAYARAVTGNRKGAAAVPIYKVLTDFGFRVEEKLTGDLKRSIQAYAHLRNALFHNSEFQRVVPIGGQPVELRLLEYVSTFAMLAPLVAIRALGFDDGEINWDSWIDRQPFK